jgi:hypothetical protein
LELRDGIQELRGAVQELQDGMAFLMNGKVAPHADSMAKRLTVAILNNESAAPCGHGLLIQIGSACSASPLYYLLSAAHVLVGLEYGNDNNAIQIQWDATPTNEKLTVTVTVTVTVTGVYLDKNYIEKGTI